MWDATDNVLTGGYWNEEPGLAAGASYSQTLSVGMPAVAPGDYYLIVRTDVYEQVFESNEMNNTRALAIHLTAPDLTPTVLSVAATRVAGRQVEVSWTVKNQGGGEAAYCYDAIYFSADAVWDAADTALMSWYPGQAWLPGPATAGQRPSACRPSLRATTA